MLIYYTMKLLAKISLNSLILNDTTKSTESYEELK